MPLLCSSRSTAALPHRAATPRSCVLPSSGAYIDLCVCASSQAARSSIRRTAPPPGHFLFSCRPSLAGAPHVAAAICRRRSTRATSTPDTAALRPHTPPRQRSRWLDNARKVFDKLPGQLCTREALTSGPLLLPLVSVVPGCLFAEFLWLSLLLVMSIVGCCESPEGSYLRM
jgi:hypothetical protein